MMDAKRLVAARAQRLEISGIRRIFEAAAKLRNPINLSIGQPDFAVPDALKDAAKEAIDADRNGYTMTRGDADLLRSIALLVQEDLGWADPLAPGSPVGVMTTSGTSGALLLMQLALLEEGDEIIIPDPYFVAYPGQSIIAGARAVRCDTYPDFRMTADRVEPLLTERTKAVLLCTPSNPCGAVLTERQCAELLELCAARDIVLVSDEIYDVFVFPDAPKPSRAPSGTMTASRLARAPSPGRLPGAEERVLVIRGFGKTYGCTGWRMGFAAGPAWLIDAMAKLQQYSFVCAPSIAQRGCLAAFDVDPTPLIERFVQRRDMVVEQLSPVANVSRPQGAFYAFVEVPQRLGLTGTQLADRLMEEREVVVIPGNVFSDRDTHFRLSYAVDEETLARGLEAIRATLAG